MFGSTQRDIDFGGDNNKVVAGDDNSSNNVTNHFYTKKTRLSNLFDKLNEQFNSDERIDKISRDLQKYLDRRDTIGLEVKLANGGKDYLFEDAEWLKEQYYKKLVQYQYFEPAQDIHAHILAIVLEKFRNNIYPLMREKKPDSEILKTVSETIIAPIQQIIQNEGCNDIMGLSSTDIEGMIYFLTGRCHIRWDI